VLVLLLLFIFLFLLKRRRDIRLRPDPFGLNTGALSFIFTAKLAVVQSTLPFLNNPSSAEHAKHAEHTEYHLPKESCPY
jgi:hypothetical protein